MMPAQNRPDDPSPARGTRARRPRPTPLPRPRGPLSGALRTLLAGPPTRDGSLLASRYITDLWSPEDDVPWWRAGDDVAVALIYLAELRRRGFEGVDDGWEGHPLLATAHRTLSEPVRRGLAEMRRACEPMSRATGYGVVRLVLAMVANASTSDHVAAAGFREPFEDEVVITAVQRLRERDAHAALIPSLAGAPRHLLARTLAAGVAEGDVDDEREAVSAVLRALELQDSTGAHLDALPGAALWRLAVLDHLVTHRSLRAAALGWLTAADAMAAAGRFVTGDALRARGFDPATTAAWDACVMGEMTTLEATEHLVEAEPHLAADVLLGARACVTAGTFVDDALDHAREVGRRTPPTDAHEASGTPEPHTDLIPTPEGLA
jgi:hypothetical protein